MNGHRIVNPKDIKALLKRDKLFAKIHKQYGAPPDWSREPGFISLCKIILEQQVSLASADAHYRKLAGYLCARNPLWEKIADPWQSANDCPDGRSLLRRLLVEEFTPVHIMRLTDEEMRSCQISRQKAKYLRALSTEIAGGTLDLAALPALEEPQVREKLLRIKGIGHWTTDIYLMFCLQARDIFPIGDIAVINTVREFAGDKSLEAIKEMAEEWRPYRSLATYYLWHHYLRKRNRSGGPV